MSSGTGRGNRTPSPSEKEDGPGHVVSIQRRAQSQPRKPNSNAATPSLQSLLTAEDRETNFNAPENARRACATVNTALASNEEHLRRRTAGVVSLWLARGETEWIDEINTTTLFTVTLDMTIRQGGSKNVKEKIMKAYINRLRASRDSIEWIRWLRSALGNGYLSPIDCRTSLDPLLQLVGSLVLKSRHAIRSAHKNQSARKLSELWILHAEVSIEVALLLSGEADGLYSLLAPQPQILIRHFAPGATSITISSPGHLALRFVEGIVSYRVESSQPASDWLVDSCFANIAYLPTYAELDAWLLVFAFALQKLSPKSSLSSYLISCCTNLLRRILAQYGEVCASSGSAIESWEHGGLIQLLEALCGMQDLAFVADAMLSLNGRHLCIDIQRVTEAYYQVCTNLAEVGVQLLADQCIRFGSLLATNSYSLNEGDALERMLCEDMNWLMASPLIRLLSDGSILHRIASAAVWPTICPILSDHFVTLAKQVVKVKNPDNTPTWDRLAKILNERYGRTVELHRSSGSSMAREFYPPFAEARREFASFVHDDRLIPTFARLDADADIARLNRAREFVDNMLTILECDVNEEGTWQDRASSVFWECLFESDIQTNEKESSTSKNSSVSDEDFIAWLCAWTCRGLTVTTLRSRFGSAKDTFQQLESAMEKHRAATDKEGLKVAVRFLLDLVWNLHREILVCSSIHPDGRIAGFFSKNSETCQSWLLRLVSLAIKLDEQLAISSGAASIFYYTHYDDAPFIQTPPLWTRWVLEGLAQRRCTSVIRALSTRSGLVSSGSSRAWVEAFELFSCGAYIKAAKQFERVSKLLHDELEDAELKNEEDDAKESSAAQFAFESYLRLGKWAEARRLLPHIKDPESVNELLSAFEAFQSDSTGSELLSSPLTDDIQSKLRSSPILAFLRWCSEPSSTQAASLFKSACLHARLSGRSDVQELLDFHQGKTRSSVARSNDELVTVLAMARKRFRVPSDVKQITTMAISAAKANDLETVRELLSDARPVSADEALRDSELYCELIRLGRNWTDDGIKRALDRLVPVSLAERQAIELTAESATLVQNDALATSSNPTLLRTLAQYARERGDQALSAHLMAKTLKLDTTLSQLSLLVEYLDVSDDNALDSDTRAEQLASFPSGVLKNGLTHLLARATTQASMTLALEKLATVSPRETVWGILAADRSAVIASAERHLDPSVIREASALKTALVEASRTFDEDWDDLFDELAKKPWIERAMAALESEKQPLNTKATLLTQVKRLWEETLGAPESTHSAYHKKLLASDAGDALRRWSDQPMDFSLYSAARIALGQWFAEQGSRRSFGDLCLEFEKITQMSVVPGCEKNLFDVDSRVDILRTKTRPRKITFKSIKGGSNGSKSFLLKSAEDLRQDERLVQLWDMACPGKTRTYLVVPLSRRVGLIEWVDRAVPLFHAYREWRDTSWLLSRGTAGALDSHMELEKGERQRVTEQFQQALVKNKMNKLAAFREVKSKIDQKLVAKFIWNTSRDSSAWWSRQLTFASSCGWSSLLGWMVGLGDRHLDNILFDVDTGHIVHVDLNVCFDKGLKLRVPETVPFRLTGIMVGAMPFGERRAALERGPFGEAMNEALEIVRLRRNEITAFLSSFVFDPIRPQSSTSRVGLLDIDKGEFETLRAMAIRDIKEYLSDSDVTETQKSGYVSGIDQAFASETTGIEDAKLALDRAKGAAHKALAECSRLKERATASYNKIVTSERTLRKAVELNDASIASSPASFQETLAELMRAEQLCSQIVAQTLGRSIAIVKEAPSVSKLGLACVELKDKLTEALQGVNNSVWPKQALDSGSSHASIMHQVSQSDVTEMQNFRVVVQSMIDPKVIKTLVAECRTDPIAQKAEKALKHVQDVLGLVDALISLHHEFVDACPGARSALASLHHAFVKSRISIAMPAVMRACKKAPSLEHCLWACDQVRTRPVNQALKDYQEMLPLSPETFSVALSRLIQGLEILRNAEPSKELSDRAETQAKQANMRVKARLEDRTDSTRLVSNLIELATNERNLSEMWIGWMPFL